MSVSDVIRVCFVYVSVTISPVCFILPTLPTNVGTKRWGHIKYWPIWIVYFFCVCGDAENKLQPKFSDKYNLLVLSIELRLDVDAVKLQTMAEIVKKGTLKRPKQLFFSNSRLMITNHYKHSKKKCVWVSIDVYNMFTCK